MSPVERAPNLRCDALHDAPPFICTGLLRTPTAAPKGVRHACVRRGRDARDEWERAEHVHTHPLGSSCKRVGRAEERVRRTARGTVRMCGVQEQSGDLWQALVGGGTEEEKGVRAH
jgi:hypothetical protein